MARAAHQTDAVAALQKLGDGKGDALLVAAFRYGRGGPYITDETKDTLIPVLEKVSAGETILAAAGLGEGKVAAAVWDEISEAFVEEGNSPWRFKGAIRGEYKMTWGNSPIARESPLPEGTCEVCAPISRICERILIARAFFDHLFASREPLRNGAAAILDMPQKDAFYEDLAWRKLLISASYNESPITRIEFAAVYKLRKETGALSINLEDDINYYKRSKATHDGPDGKLSVQSTADASRLIEAWSGKSRDEMLNSLTRNLKFHTIHRPLLHHLLEQHFAGAGERESDEVPEMR